MKKTIITLTLAALSLSTAASAAVNARQINQERRIDAGHRSGKLTNRETAYLRSQQRAIRREEARMRARHGGHLTDRDARIIHAKQAQANRAILIEKRNHHYGKDHLPL